MSDISPDSVKAQLERILTSPEFVSGKRLGQFLRYVVDQTLNGQSRRIKQFTIAVDALGYGSDFDPQSNPTVRILARRLRRSLQQYYYSQSNGDPIRIEINKGGYIPTFSKNSDRPEESGSSECPSPVVASTSLDPLRPIIAVMMIDSLNAKEAFEYVATGLTEEIIIALTHFPDFSVVGPIDRDLIRREKLDVHGIGQKYGARFVLDGTLRTHGKIFRLTVRLADTLSGQQLWGQAVDYNLRNGSMMAVENDLVGQVAATIADSYGIIPRTLTNEYLARRAGNPDAYEAVLHYYHHFRVLTHESYVNAMNALEKSVRYNPDHALTLAALGDLVASTYLFGYDEDESNLAHAEVLARKAVALDPNCQVARFAMALIYFLKFQRSLFLDEVEQAIRLNPNNAHFIAVISLHMAMVGEWERAMKLIRKAMLLNPHHPGWYHIHGFMNYYRQGEYDLALIEAQRFNTPDFFWDPLIRAAVLGQLERRVDSRNAVDELLALIPDFKRRGPDLVRRLAYLDENVNMLLDGLQKAGLETHAKV